MGEWYKPSQVLRTVVTSGARGPISYLVGAENYRTVRSALAARGFPLAPCELAVLRSLVLVSVIFMCCLSARMLFVKQP